MSQPNKEREYERGVVFVEPDESGQARVVLDGWVVADVPLSASPHTVLAEALSSAVSGKPSTAVFEANGTAVAEIAFEGDRDAYRIGSSGGGLAEGFINIHVALLQLSRYLEDNAFALTPGASEKPTSSEGPGGRGGRWKLVKPLLEKAMGLRHAANEAPSSRLRKAVNEICASKTVDIHELGDDIGGIANVAGPLAYFIGYGVQILDRLDTQDLAELATMENERIARMLWAAAEAHYHADLDWAGDEFLPRAEQAILDELEWSSVRTPSWA